MPYAPTLLQRWHNRNLPAAPLTDRWGFILERCAGRRVLHLGCVDWPFLEEKMKSGALLQSKLVERAASVVGVDSDAEGARLFNERGWETIVADVQDLPELPEVDVVVAGEIIEHVSNPGLFLDSLAARCPSTEVIVTTVNAFAAKRFWRFLIGFEQVHPDHVAYYSPLTLRAILTRHGYEISEEYPYPIGPEFKDLPSYYRVFERAGTLVQPWTGDGMIAVARTPAARR
jgi:Methyltransferase domain